MKAINIHIGDVYEIRISGRPARVRVMSARPDGGFVVANERTGRVLVLRSGRRLRCNLTLFDAAVARYADLAAGNDPGEATRTVQAGDFDGCEAELERLRLATLRTVNARLLAEREAQ